MWYVHAYNTWFNVFRFDVLVNGGGAVTLQFQRSPFRPLTRTVFVPWNQIVVLPPVAMQLSDDTDVYRDNGGNSLSYGNAAYQNIHNEYCMILLLHPKLLTAKDIPKLCHIQKYAFVSIIFLENKQP